MAMGHKKRGNAASPRDLQKPPTTRKLDKKLPSLRPRKCKQLEITIVVFQRISREK
jgi:hypothetical protein